jgi:uncharacterized membrane protein
MKIGKQTMLAISSSLKDFALFGALGLMALGYLQHVAMWYGIAAAAWWLVLQIVAHIVMAKGLQND